MTDLHLAVETPAVKVDLRHPSLYLNRELSWLEFNGRVLTRRRCPHPLLERSKFLASSAATSTSSSDAGGRAQAAGGGGVASSPPTDSRPKSSSRVIGHACAELIDAAPALLLRRRAARRWREHGVRLVTELRELPARSGSTSTRYFEPSLPRADAARRRPGPPFPYISNLSLSLAVVLRDSDGRGAVRPGQGARRSCRAGCRCRRPAPVRAARAGDRRATSKRSFPGMEILGWYTFRITRNTDLELDEREADDLLEPRSRRRSATAASARWCASRCTRRCRRRCGSCCSPSSTRSRSAGAALDRRRHLRGRGPARRRRPDVALGARPAGAQGSAVPSGHAGAARRRRATSSTVIREGDILRPPPVRLLRHDRSSASSRRRPTTPTSWPSS